MGRHHGIETFTIGQRKGLGIALGEPHFVIKIDPDSFDVVLGPKEALDQQVLHASDANWLTDVPTTSFSGLVQIRYNSSAVPARITPAGDNSFNVEFTQPASGVAPGQLCVVYQDDRVLGGGWIA